MNDRSHQSLPEYADAAAVLKRAGLRQSPAEAHGFALGLLVTRVPDAKTVWNEEWYSELDPADVLAGECRGVLERIFASVFSAERDGSPQLTLLLPQDIEVNSGRLAAVRDWCQGFLFGFGLGGAGRSGSLSGQARELLHDLAEVTRLDTADAENSADNQAALIEIEEYLRVGVMLIRDELRERERDESE